MGSAAYDEDDEGLSRGESRLIKMIATELSKETIVKDFLSQIDELI